MGDQVVEVACYSGSSYAERPQKLFWQGNEFQITRWLRSQQIPAGRSFDVILENGWTIQLKYLYNENHWIASSLPDNPINCKE
jgi:hypothetical protein